MVKVILIFAIVFLGGCSVKNFERFEGNDQTINVKKEISKTEYRDDVIFEWLIQKGDRVEITAFNQSSNTGSSGQLTELLNRGGEQYYTQRRGDEGILIGNDGSVILPLVGSVKIAGLTEKEASQKLISEFKKYLRNPFVNVRLLNQKLFVLGEVRQPGDVLITNGTMSLFEALATSGDVTDYADRTNIKIIRGDMRNPEIRQINLADVNSIKASSLILRPNDIVYVASRDSKAEALYYEEKLPFWQYINAILQTGTQSSTIRANLWGTKTRN